MKKKLFIAIKPDIPKEVLLYYNNIKKLLSKEQINWVPKKNWHFTLKFIGFIEEEKIPLIQEILAKITQKQTAFTISWGKAGYYSRNKKPAVLWIGLDRNEQMSLMADELDNRLAELGISLSVHAFQAHLTFGRMKHSKDVTLIRNIINKQPQLCCNIQKIDCFMLLESISRNEAPEYKIISTYKLTS